MKKYLYPLALGAALFFCGCSKEKESIVLAGEYQTGMTVLTAPIQLFTSNGLVDNQAVVDRFLSRRSWSSSDFSRVDVAAPSGASLMLTIRPDKRAVLISKYSARTDTIKTILTSQTSQYLVLTHVDSAQTGVFTKPLYPSRCQQLADKIRSEYAGRHDYPISYNSGDPQYFSRVRAIKVIAIKNGKLFLPQFSWLIESSDSYSKCGLEREDNYLCQVA